MALVCHVSFRITPGQEAVFKAAAVDIMKETKREPGSIVFQFAQDVEDQSVFHVTEFWADKDAAEHHMAQDYVARCQAIMRPIVSVIGMTRMEGPLQDAK